MSKGEVKSLDFEELRGIYIHGVVAGRRKRNVMVKGEEKEVVNYCVDCGNKSVYVDEWEPKGEYYAVADLVAIPVTARGFARNGSVGVGFSVAKIYDSGEEF